MRLALAEGRVTKWRALYDELTPRDIAELDAFYQLEPWGDARDDVRHAVMTSTLVAAISGRKIDALLLSRYLGNGVQEVTPDAMSEMMRRAYPSRSK
jgi:hypothetical protein